MMNHGWIKLHRKIQDNPLWRCEPFTRGQAWVDLLLLANHNDNFFYKRGVKVDIQRGQVGVSEVGLSDRWKWSRNKVRKFLNDLEKEQQIKQQKTNVTQIVTIINYSQYQEKEQQTEQQKDTKRTAEGQQKDTNKNDKNVKKEKNEKKRFSPPSLTEIQNYFKEKIKEMNSNLDAKNEAIKFESHYGAKGWMVGKNKMKDWKKAVSGWIARSSAHTKEVQSYSVEDMF